MTTLDPPDPPPPPRHRYTISRLLSVRRHTTLSPSSLHHQLSQLGPLATPNALQSCISNLYENRRHYSVEQLRALRPSRPPSSDNQRTKRPSRWDHVAPHTRHPSNPWGPSSPTTPVPSPPARSPSQSGRLPNTDDPRTSLPSLFPSPPDKPHGRASPPLKRPDFSARLSVRTDPPSTAPINVEERRGFAPMSPRDEFRRRSPSPMASSPKSSSPPPGFEGFVAIKAGSKNGGRAASIKEKELLYKSRICKGPDMERNFATRIAYRGTNDTLGSVAKTLEEVGGEGKEETDVPAERIESTLANGILGAEQAANLKEVKEETRGVGRGAQRPPVVSYNISGVVSFEDFSKRLAAEVALNDDFDNETRQSTEDVPGVDSMDSHDLFLEPESGENTIQEHLPTLSQHASTDTNGHPALPPKQNPVQSEKADSVNEMTGQEAVDELTKWFGRISASSPQKTQDKDLSFLPVSEVERQMTESRALPLNENAEELDSNVLSFFDTIRSQAVNDQPDLRVENSDCHGPMYREGPSSEMENYFHSRYPTDETFNKRDFMEDAEQLKTSEVEQFFQLFTDGKPVYKTNEVSSENHGLASSNILQTETSPSSAKNSLPEIQQGSDVRELERWFRALASENRSEA